MGLAMVHIVKTVAQSLPAAVQTTTQLLEWADRHSQQVGVGAVKELPAWQLEQWKTFAASRFQVAWGEFLKREGADQDPSYARIKGIYEDVMKAARAGAEGRGGNNDVQGQPEKRKKKKKRKGQERK